MMGRNRSESSGNGAALDDSSITPVQKLVSCTSVLLLNGHSEEKNREETVSREDTGGGIHTTRYWYPTIHQKRAIRIKAQERAQSSIATTTDDDDKDTDAKFRANLHRLERFYSGTTTIDAESATGRVVLPTMDSSANHDTNEIDLSSSSDEESSCASSGGNEDDSSRSTPCNKRIKRDGTTNDVSVTNRRLDGVTATSELDVTKPHFLTLGTGCASPSPLRGKFVAFVFCEMNRMMK